jgi:two-component system sensor histidine kinase PilS (NtrC family)
MSAGTSSIFGSGILRDRGPSTISVQYWRSLYYLNLYRLALAVFFLTLALSGSEVGTVGREAPRLFLMASAAYGLFGVLSLATITHGRPAFATQAQLQLMMDLGLIVVLLHASGGVHSGLGLLTMVVVAAAGVLLGGRRAIFFAALATILVLAEHLLSGLGQAGALQGTTQVGVLGIGLFTTSFLIYGLASRIRQTEELAERRGSELETLAQLNALIIERMQTGLVVVDRYGSIRLINDTAHGLLGDTNRADAALDAAAPPLAAALNRWRQGISDPLEATTLPASGARVIPRFAALGQGEAYDVLIMLEDVTLTEQQNLQSRLAALGRLTAGIAHEIRNPLGAISHAGELLAESSRLDAQDRRLAGIIADHCRRINRLIVNVMQLGRSGARTGEALSLARWTRTYIEEFIEQNTLDPQEVACRGDDVPVTMNPDHLEQVVGNLLHNALRFSPPRTAGPRAELRYGASGDQPFLDVVDYGPGVPEEDRDKIFEPFFTTEPKGTGLGLYIAREICNGNGATLECRPHKDGTNRFRIRFPARSRENPGS